MKKLFLITDSTANKVSYFHVMLLLLSLPFDRFYSHLILISLAIHTLINLNKKDIKPVFTLTNLMLQSVFFVTVIGTLYTINKTQAFNEWSRQVVILLVPIIFCLNTLDLKKYRNNLLLVFALGCTATILYLYLQVFITIKYYHFPVSTVFSSAFTNHNFSEPIDIHATFFSMQIAVALVYLLYALVKETATTAKILYLFCSAVLMAGILQLSSKSVFAGLLIILNVALPYFLLTGRARIKYITVAASISVLIIAGIYSMGNFKKHYITDLKKDLSKASANELTDPRLARWEVALQLAAQAPLIGHGSGSEIQLLKERFFQHKFYRSYLHGLNAHNQFISFFIKTGIWGVLVYLVILFFGFRMALSKNDLLLFSFMVIITAVSFSENYLDVDKGVFFYAMFFSLFIFSYNLKNNDLNEKIAT
ncbi:O-antigen ligase family protein [Mucilaginibacter sp.]|jgi:O-antigen ligase|uniref:O-antigen ligase family protein n=1 Tax=Mucilaginibacter sp. TaxID=1882438 RepID=UPI003566ADF7